jgi:hypothetical protein
MLDDHAAKGSGMALGRGLLLRRDRAGAAPLKPGLGGGLCHAVEPVARSAYTDYRGSEVCAYRPREILGRCPCTASGSEGSGLLPREGQGLRSIGAAHAPSRLARGRFMERQANRPGRVDHAHHHARCRNRRWPQLWVSVVCGRFPCRRRTATGIGWGGQYLLIVPKLDLVVAMNCGNYHRPLTEQSAVARAVVGEVVLPGFV